MVSQRFAQRVLSLSLVLGVVALLAAPANAQLATGAPIIGTIENITVDDINDPFSAGTITVGGTVVIVPANLLVDLPANRLTLQEFVTGGPSVNGSGVATLLCNRMPDGRVIAGDVFIEKGQELLSGAVTFINHTDGYLRVNGTPGVDAGGVICRINDPDGRHTVQQGAGCDGGPNCSADPRFGLDPDNYTIVFATGYPAGIPSTLTVADDPSLVNRLVGSDANGVGDPFCPASNRNSPVVTDSRFFAPIRVGDTIFAEGNYEILGGVRFVSAHTLTVAVGLTTREDSTQPDYMIFDEAEWDIPGFQNGRARFLAIGFTTLGNSQVDLFSLHVDPSTGENVEVPLGSTVGNPQTINQGVPPTSAGIFKIRYDVDFIAGAPLDPRGSPVQNLIASGLRSPLDFPGGGTLAEEFSVLSPIAREMQGRTRRVVPLQPGIETLDVSGNVSTNAQYLTPVGLGHPEFVEIDLGALNTPFIFSGIPWNLDRRLGTGGGVGNVLADPQPLCPFPNSGLDPRTQTLLPIGGAARIFSFVPFDATASVEASFTTRVGVDCPVTIPIVPDPANNAPRAESDIASTDEGVAVTIDVLVNDLDIDGDVLSVDITSDTVSSLGGTIVNNGADLTYTPAPAFDGIDRFNYVATDGRGGLSQATVFVIVRDTGDINVAPVAVADSATTPEQQTVIIDVLANDTDANGDPLVVAAFDAVSAFGGSVAASGAGVAYTPAAGFVGLDTFSYTISDGRGGLASANVTVDVTLVIGTNGAPIAVADSATTDQGVAVSLNLLANDSDPDGDVVSLLTLNTVSANGGTIANNGGGNVTYTPAAGFSGTDVFGYSITDGNGGTASSTATITVIAAGPVNTAPVANADSATTDQGVAVTLNLLANDTDADGDALSLLAVDATSANGGTIANLGGGNVSYTPAAGFTGSDSFGYSISDGQGGVASSTATITVNAVAAALIEAIVLFDAGADVPIQTITNGTVLSLSALPNLMTFEAVAPSAQVESVRMNLDNGFRVRVESGAPYVISGNAGANYSPLLPFPGLGSHTIVTTAHPQNGANGGVLETSTVTFTIVP